MPFEFLHRILSLYEKCRAAEVGFTLAEFRELLTDVTDRSLGESSTAADRAQFLESLRLDDLILARACARGHEGAWERFMALYREKLYCAAGAIARDDAVARELADSLYADLFGVQMREDGRRISKLASYLGRGSLEGWLRTVLAQNYVNRFRSQQKLVAFDESVGASAKTSLSAQPDQNNPLLARSIHAALAALSSEERFLLAAYYLDGRTLAEIGRMVNVHESTISRRLEKITSGLRKQIIARLRAAGLSKRAAEEILETDVRDLGVDVRKSLAQERQA